MIYVLLCILLGWFITGMIPVLWCFKVIRNSSLEKVNEDLYGLSKEFNIPKEHIPVITFVITFVFGFIILPLTLIRKMRRNGWKLFNFKMGKYR